MKQTFLFSAALLSAVGFMRPVYVSAQSSSSTNYQVDQTFFGTGGELNAQSTNFQAKQTTGELGIGNTEGTNYQAYAGFNTTDEPFLEFLVTGSNIDLNYLDPLVAKMSSATFYVRAWQSGGYVVRTVADPPSNGNGTIAPMTTKGVSVVGTEQFGINLVANTSPATVGANPVQSPDSTFAFGYADDDYNDTNQYKYVKNDIIARADESTSVTTYTISYLFNISLATLPGQYTFRHNLVVTAQY